MRILYIEDNPNDFLLVQRLCGQTCQVEWDCHLERADRLSAGIERLSQGGIDVVLLDMKLPDGHGVEMVDRLRPFAVPIIVLTGTLLEKDAAIQAIRQGAQDYLLKDGLDAERLERAIRYAMERKRVETELQKAHQALQEKVTQIEGLNRVMMGREERILELKAELKQLKDQLHIQEGKPESS